MGVGGGEHREGTIESTAISQRACERENESFFPFDNVINKSCRSHVNIIVLPIEKIFRTLRIQFIDKYYLGNGLFLRRGRAAGNKMISNLQETVTTTKHQHGIYSFLALLPLEKRRGFCFGRRLAGRR